MALTLYEQVSLKRDVLQDGRSASDAATLVNTVPVLPPPHPAIPKLPNALGKSICPTAVSIEDVEPSRSPKSPRIAIRGKSCLSKRIPRPANSPATIEEIDPPRTDEIPPVRTPASPLHRLL